MADSTAQPLIPASNGLASPRLLLIARRSLEEADTLPEITALIDQAEAMRVLVRKAEVGQDAQNDWAEYKLDAERKAGTLVAEVVAKDGLSRGAAEPLRGDMTSPRKPTLVDLGVAEPGQEARAKQRSSRWQLVAELPEADRLAALLTTGMRA